MARSLGSRATSLGIGWKRRRDLHRPRRSSSPLPPLSIHWRRPFLRLFRYASRGDGGGASIDAPGFRYLIRQYAPVALTHGSWVAPLAGTATGHRRPFALLFRYHAGGGAQCVRDGYRRLLALQGIGLPEVVDDAFIRDGSLLDAAFVPAVLWLCIARSPQGLFPELLGMLLGQALGLLPFRALMAGSCPPAIRADISLGPLLGPATPHDAGLDPISTLVEDHLETARIVLGRQGVVHAWHRIRNGLLAQFLAERGLFRSAFEAWEARRRSDRHAAVLAILQAKRPYALGQHRDKTLGDRRIEDWLAPGADLWGAPGCPCRVRSRGSGGASAEPFSRIAFARWRHVPGLSRRRDRYPGGVDRGIGRVEVLDPRTAGAGTRGAAGRLPRHAGCQ